MFVSFDTNLLIVAVVMAALTSSYVLGWFGSVVFRALDL